MNIPNAITAARIALCPVIVLLALATNPILRYTAFGIFLLAAFSDIYDGHLARKHGWVSNIGKLLDPIADKLLVAAALIPIFIITRRADGFSDLPLFGGPLPLWVLIVIFGRELAVTFFRAHAVRRGIVIAAGKSGKYKSFFTYLFGGALLLWFPLLRTATTSGWDTRLWDLWAIFHSAFAATTLALALFLTLFSLGDYLWRYRSLVTAGGSPQDRAADETDRGAG